MSSEDLRSISATTGSYRQLTPLTAKAAEAKTGNAEPTSGKNVPVVEKTSTDMKELARKLNVASRSIGRDLRFEVDMNSGRSVIQVLDSETGEVIRQIPPEKASLYRSESGAVALRLYDAQV